MNLKNYKNSWRMFAWTTKKTKYNQKEVIVWASRFINYEDNKIIKILKSWSLSSENITFKQLKELWKENILNFKY